MSEWLGSGGASTGRQQRTFGRQRSQSTAPLFDGTSVSRSKATGPSFEIAIDEEDNPFSDSNTTRSRSYSASGLSNPSRGLKKYDENVGTGSSTVGEFGIVAANGSKSLSKRKNTSKEDAQDAKKKKEARAASPSQRQDQHSIHSSTLGAFGTTNA